MNFKKANYFFYILPLFFEKVKNSLWKYCEEYVKIIIINRKERREKK